MTSIKDGDNGKDNNQNPDGGEFLAGAGGGNKPAEGEKKADPATAEPANTVAGAGTNDNSKRNLKTNLSSIFKWAAGTALFGPPILYGIIAAGDIIGGRGIGASASDFWHKTTAVWETIVDVPVGVARGAAGLLENNVVTAGPRADVVLYCPPKPRNNAMNAEQATRTFAELNQLSGYARGMVHGSINDVTRAVEAGGYPILVGSFSDSANGRPMPTVRMEIAPSAATQTCPQGDWGTPQSWRLTR